MTPTYINILNVYAFCNTHDITWGTKGDTKPEKLGGIKVWLRRQVQGGPADGRGRPQRTSTRRSSTSSHGRTSRPRRDPLTSDDKKEDYYKGFRSVIVLAWMFIDL